MSVYISSFAQNAITHYVNVLIYSVSWHVLETMKTVSHTQLQALRENIMNGEEPTPSHSAPNFRGAKANRDLYFLIVLFLHKMR